VSDRKTLRAVKPDEGGTDSFLTTSAWRISVSSVRSSSPVGTLHRYQVIVNDVDNPESAHMQAVVPAPVKTPRRVGI
jgi:hypothetical protein